MRTALVLTVLMLSAFAVANIGASSAQAHPHKYVNGYELRLTVAGVRQDTNYLMQQKCRAEFPKGKSVWKMIHPHSQLHHWLARAAYAREIPKAACLPPHDWLWECIHSREGSWTDPNSPYYGGLQMGHWFMGHYGSALYSTKGTADNWTSLEQKWVAERAYASEGYSRSWLYGQWPNTAPPCI